MSSNASHNVSRIVLQTFIIRHLSSVRSEYQRTVSVIKWWNMMCSENINSLISGNQWFKTTNNWTVFSLHKSVDSFIQTSQCPLHQIVQWLPTTTSSSPALQYLTPDISIQCEVTQLCPSTWNTQHDTGGADMMRDLNKYKINLRVNITVVSSLSHCDMSNQRMTGQDW